MIRTLLLGALSLLSIGLFAQHEHTEYCGTEAPDDYVNEIYEGVFRNVVPEGAESVFYAPMKLVLLSRTDGTGVKNAEDVYELACELNSEYAKRDVEFWLYEMPRVIPSTRFQMTNRQIDGLALVQAHNEPYVTNVYFLDLSQVGSGPGLNLCGFSNFPGAGFQGQVPAGVNPLHNNGATFLNNLGTCTTPGASTTFIHELGHFFSLLHPFQGTSSNPSAVTSEYVTRGAGANCTTAGDGLCDTDADYCDLQTGRRWNGCTPAQTVMDFRGDVFKPDPTFYMSYSSDACQNKFSVQQGQQMANCLALPSTSSRSRRYLSFYSRPNQADITTDVRLNYPAQNQTNVVPNFIPLNWSPVAGATNYHIEISTTPTFNPSSFHKVFRTFTDINTFLYTDQLFAGLTPGTLLYWRVKPLNQVSFCRPFIRGQFRTGAAYPASVEELSDENLSLYPNLLSNGQSEVNLYSESLNLTNASFSLTDMSGKIIRSERIGNVESGAYTILELGNLNPGMYFIQVTDGKSIVKKKLIVQ